MQKFWNMSSNVGDDRVLNMYVYGEIMTDQSAWFGSEDDVVCREFIKDLHRYPNAKRINIYINSGGGEVFAAVSMAQQLKKHKAEVHTYVEGICASAATIIAMAGDVRHMSVSGLYMIHLPSGSFRGNKFDLEKGKEVLSKVEDIIRLTYSEKVNLSDEQLTAMLEHETWLTADEAYEYGFITDIEKASEDTIDKLVKDLQNDIIDMCGVEFKISAYADPEQIRQKLTTISNREISDTPSQGGTIMNFTEFLNSLPVENRSMVEEAIKDQLNGATETLTNQITELTDKLSEATTQLESAQNALQEAEQKIADSEARVKELEDKAAPVDEDAKFLDSLPEAAKNAVLEARAQAAAATKALQDATEEKARIAFHDKLKSFGNLPLQNEHVDALYALSQADPTSFGKIEDLFKVANTAMQQNFQDLGSTEEGGAETDAFSQIEKLVAMKRKEDPTMDYNTAFQNVVTENPSLYEQYRSER